MKRRNQDVYDRLKEDIGESRTTHQMCYVSPAAGGDYSKGRLPR